MNNVRKKSNENETFLQYVHIESMKKLFFSFLFLTVIYGLISSQPVLAGGDKVRGDESVGPSYQEGECPFYG